MTCMRTITRLCAFGALLATATSCGDVVRTGRSPVMLIINNLQGSPGGGFGAGTFSNVLHSDVQVVVNTPTPPCPCPTFFSDNGQAIISLALKDIGTTSTPLAPTTNNQVTLTRYRVEYYRADGRNTPGVDVPFSFDGAITATVPAGGQLQIGFELVKHVAKEESPLSQLITSPSIITTIAHVTFYGTDAVGNVVSVTGQIQVDFANFGDA